MISTFLHADDPIVFSTIFAIYALSAVMIHLLCFDRRTRTFVASFGGVVAPLFMVALTMFSLTAAFLGASVWSNFQSNSDAVKKESVAIASYIAYVDAFPDLKKEGLHELARAYAASVIEVEWPLIAQSKDSPETDQKFSQLLHTTVAVISQLESPSPALYTLTRAIESVTAARLTRLSLVHQDVDSARWLCTFILGLLAQFGIAIVHLGNRRSNALALTLGTTSISVMLAFIALAVSTHQGAVSISKSPFEQILVMPRY